MTFDCHHCISTCLNKEHFKRLRPTVQTKRAYRQSKARFFSVHVGSIYYYYIYPSWSYLPPANDVCEGYVFTRVCHSVHRGGGLPAPVHVGMHTQLPLPPETRGRPPLGPEADTPQSSVCWELRATNGRSASYWNAFFLGTFFRREISRSYKFLC